MIKVQLLEERLIIIILQRLILKQTKYQNQKSSLDIFSLKKTRLSLKV